MIVCPECGGRSQVRDSRYAQGTIRRRRRCKSCKARWTTYEVFADEGGDRPDFEEPYALMRNLKDLTVTNRQTVYAVIRGLLSDQILDQIKGKDAA